MPLMRCQSTIDKPDSVRRVTPPKTTEPITIPAQPTNQYPENQERERKSLLTDPSGQHATLTSTNF